jgi:hypothetical protein
MVASPALPAQPSRARRVLLWLAVLPAAVLAVLVVGVAIDVLLNVAELSPVAAFVRDRMGTQALGQLLQSFFAPLVFIWAGTRVAPSGKRAVALVLALLYLAYNAWQFVQLAQAGATWELITGSGQAGFFVALGVANVLGFAVGIYLMVFRKPVPAIPATVGQ